MQDALTGDPFAETDGRYTKIQSLGAGSFGFVVLAKNRAGKSTAVKVRPPKTLMAHCVILIT